VLGEDFQEVKIVKKKTKPSVGGLIDLDTKFATYQVEWNKFGLKMSAA